LDRVDEISKRLTAEGHRVVTLSGADSSKEKDQKKADYQAGKYDVMIASDAGAVGANLQAGKWLVQFDTPMTAMLHAQRNGRIHRMGQTEDVELIDLVANHPAERRNRDRLSKKYALRSVMTSPQDGLDEQGLSGYLSRARAGKLESAQKVFDVTESDREPEIASGSQYELAA
jgi:superfamily II DNA/RNA helicase